MDIAQSQLWLPLLAELDRWEQNGEQAQFWLRDDDAVVPTAALDQLLALSSVFSVPITLAVSPKDTGHPLARHLADNPQVSVALHGWSHENHAPPHEKKQELGLHRGADAVLKELSSGATHLAGLYETQFTSVLVPPWNRIDNALIARLPELGVTGLSTFGQERALAVPTANTHVDLIDWKGTRGGRETAALVAETVHRLQAVFDSGGSVGILTHHLVHDTAAWAFLEQLFQLTTRHPGSAWVPVTELLPGARTV